MGNFQHRQPRDIFTASACDYNAWQDAAKAYKESESISTSFNIPFRSGLVVPFVSDSVTTEWEAITLGMPQVLPTDQISTDTFLNNLILTKEYDSKHFVAAGICVRGTNVTGATDGVFNQGLACIHGICQAKIITGVEPGDFVIGSSVGGSGQLKTLDGVGDEPIIGRCIWSNNDYALIYVLEPASSYTGLLTEDLLQGSTAECNVDNLTNPYIVHDQFLKVGEQVDTGDRVAIIRDQAKLIAVASTCDP